MATYKEQFDSAMKCETVEQATAWLEVEALSETLRGEKAMSTTVFPDDLKEIGDIPKGTVLRDWFEEGVRVIVIRGPSHPCVYFGIPLAHPLAHHSYDDLPIDCHGGLTFADEGDGKWRPEGFYWYGYDYGHSGDYMFEASFSPRDGKKWSLKEIVDDSWHALHDFKKLMKLAEEISAGKLQGAERTGGFIPIIVLLVFGAAAFAVIGAKLEQRRINQTMICHEPGKEPEPWCRNCRQVTDYPEAPMRWPSMSVPNYEGGGR